VLLDDLVQECECIVKDFKLFSQLVDFANAHRYAFVCSHNVDGCVSEEKIEGKRVAGNRKCFILPMRTSLLWSIVIALMKEKWNKEKGSLDMESGSSFADWFILPMRTDILLSHSHSVDGSVDGGKWKGEKGSLEIECGSFCRGARVCNALIENINAVQIVRSEL
jgi:hypothetical protein